MLFVLPRIRTTKVSTPKKWVSDVSWVTHPLFHYWDYSCLIRKQGKEVLIELFFYEVMEILRSGLSDASTSLVQRFQTYRSHLHNSYHYQILIKYRLEMVSLDSNQVLALTQERETMSFVSVLITNRSNF